MLGIKKHSPKCTTIRRREFSSSERFAKRALMSIHIPRWAHLTQRNGLQRFQNRNELIGKSTPGRDYISSQLYQTQKNGLQRMRYIVNFISIMTHKDRITKDA